MNETKIKLLKNKLLNLHKKYHLEIYQTLKKIYDLRKRENKKYTYKNLSEETTIKDLYTYDYVVTIMEIDKITSNTDDLINSGRITIFEVANALRKSKKLQNPVEQDKFFDKISKSFSKGMKMDDFRREVTRNKSMSDEDVWRLETIYMIRSVKKNIMERYHKLSPLNKAKIKKEVMELNSFINSRKNGKEYTLLPVRKETLKNLRHIRLHGLNRQSQNGQIDRLVSHYLTKDLTKCACGKTFKKTRKDQKYHSESCKNKHNQKRSKKRRWKW